MHRLPSIIYKSLHLLAVRFVSVKTRKQGVSKKRMGQYWMRWLCWAVMVIGPDLVVAATITAIPPIVEVRTDGACNAASPTVFSSSWKAGFVTISFSTKDTETGIDYVAQLSIDGSGTIVHVIERRFFGKGRPSKEILPIYRIRRHTPTAGPALDQIVFEDTVKPWHFESGTIYVPFKPIGSVSFSANALDPDCPAQTASKP